MTLRVDPAQILAESTSPLLGVAPWWVRVRLGDVAEVVNGAAFRSELFNGQARGEPLVRIRDVGHDSAQVYYDGPYENRHVIDHGDLLIGMDGDFRVAPWGGSRALLNQRVCHVQIPNPGLYSERFLVHVLQPYLDAVHAVTSSVTVKHLSSQTILDLPIPLPPRAEQERIYVAIDEHSSRLEAAQAAVRSARIRVRALERALLARAQTEGEEMVLDDLLLDIEAGKSFKTPGRRADPDEWGVIKVSAMTWGEFNSDENKAVPSEKSVDRRYEIRPGDLLLSRANTSEYVGATVLVGPCRQRLLLSDKSMRLLTRHGVDRRWLRFTLGSPQVRSQMSLLATGTSDSMRNISQAKVRGLRVRVPSADRQKVLADEIEEALRARGRLEVGLRDALSRTVGLHRSILAAAFSGQLVAQDPGDEPAAVLLEQIRALRTAATPNKRTPKAAKAS